MKEQPPASEQELERQHQRFLKKCDAIASTMKTLFVVTGIVGALYVTIYLPVSVSHGQSTAISVVVDFITKVKMNVVLGWGAAIAGGAWAVVERKKRLRERRERDDRIEKLEQHIDPNRTSSNLSTDGTRIRSEKSK